MQSPHANAAPAASTAEAPPEPTWPTEGHLGAAGDPVEGPSPELRSDLGDFGGVPVSDHLGPAGDPVEGV